MKSVNNHQYAFVGGGSVGPMLLIYLAQLVQLEKLRLQGCTFHLIDPEGFGNGGIAYGKNASGHILNTLRNEMSPWEPRRFHEYLLSIGREDNPYAFNLRSDYRSFLHQEFVEAKTVLAAHGVRFVEYKQLAFIRKQTKDVYAVTNKDGDPLSDALRFLSAKNIYLTVGYGPNDSFKALRKFRKHGFIDTLYPHDIAYDILLGKQRPIRLAVLGSAASLYDFVIACPIPPQDVRLAIFSSASEGLEVRKVEREHLLKDLPLNYLRNLPADAQVQDIERAIDKEFAYAAQIDAGPRTWVAFRIMGVIGTVLSELEDTVVRNFRASSCFKDIKRLGGPTSAFARARLEEYSPQFIRANIGPKDIHLTLKKTFQITVGMTSYEADCVINATGHGRHNMRILEDMKDQGLAEINPALDILRTDTSGFRLTKSGIACIGPATHFGTDGIETFAKPIERLVHEIAKDLRLASSPS